jgi:drug/metabolite transporter (DMT)-like permease
VGPAGWGAIAYMTVLSSLVGDAAWFWALGHGGITRIAPFQLMQPVLTVAFAAWLLGEAFTAPLALSAAAILTGTAVARHWAAPRRPAPRRLA